MGIKIKSAVKHYVVVVVRVAHSMHAEHIIVGIVIIGKETLAAAAVELIKSIYWFR